MSDEEWALVAPYLTLMSEDAPQREYALREVFNGLRWLVRTGAQWRWLPHDLPPWYTVYQQTQRWLRAGVFEDLVHDLRAVLRLAEGRSEAPTAAIFDARTLQSSPESGARAGYGRGYDKATPATRLPRARRRTASAWKWSSCRRPSAASCCCRVAGRDRAHGLAQLPARLAASSYLPGSHRDARQHRGGCAAAAATAHRGRACRGDRAGCVWLAVQRPPEQHTVGTGPEVRAAFQQRIQGSAATNRTHSDTKFGG